MLCGNVAGRLPVRSGQSPPLGPFPPPPGARLPNPLSSCAAAWPPLLSRSTLSIPRFLARPLEQKPLGLAGLRILQSGVGGGDLLPPCSCSPSSHVLGCSAWPPSRTTGVAAAAEPPSLAVSVPRTRQGGEVTPGEAEGLRFGTGIELVLPIMQASTAFRALGS